MGRHAPFTFGKNWREFVEGMSRINVDGARRVIEAWVKTGLGDVDLSTKTVIDVGCGSGINSLCFHLLGAKKILSFDLDEDSVRATRTLWERAGKPPSWAIVQGSILDKAFVRSLKPADVVYSWGVLHHTGAMWEAVANSTTLVKRGGIFWIALYAKGPKYQKHLRLKQAYNNTSKIGKKCMEIVYGIVPAMAGRLKRGRNPFTWNQVHDRGMNVYHDIVDWLGGLPYEVASPDDVVEFTRRRGMILEKMKSNTEGGCIEYLFFFPRTASSSRG